MRYENKNLIDFQDASANTAKNNESSSGKKNSCDVFLI